MRVVKREQWGARAPKGRDANPIGNDSTLFIHYSAGSGLAIDSRGERTAAMRELQRMHMEDRGWNDGGYSYVLFQPRGFFRLPQLFELRTFGVVPASQEGHNTGNGSVCVIMDKNDPLERATKRKLRGIVRRFPGNKVKGHKDVGSTECPGTKLYGLVPALDRVAKLRKKPLLP